MTKAAKTILLISSHVVSGSVGNRVMGFALERLGFTVWEAPTVILPHHPGLGPGERIVPDDTAFARLLDDMSGTPDAVLSGYLGTPAQAECVAELIGRIRTGNPGSLYLCDPVIGDNGSLYVAEPIAETVRDRLLPLADIATPNAFECGWLAGKDDSDGIDLTASARALAPETVIVTSHPGLMRNHVANLLVGNGPALLAEHHAMESTAHGTGDLFAALFLGRTLQGHEPRKALEMATASTFQMIAAAAKAGSADLPFAAFQDAIVQPTAPVSMRQMASKVSIRPEQP